VRSDPDDTTIRRTVEVGRLDTLDLRQQLEAAGIGLNERAQLLFEDERYVASESPRQIETVELELRDLGLVDGGTTAEVHRAAIDGGLAICPLEVAPYLRMQWIDQAEGRWVVVSSPLTAGGPEVPTGFYLRRVDGRLWLRGYFASSDYIWPADERVVFCAGGEET